MKYVIMCGGFYEQWKTPKQLQIVKGEVLVERTIRLLKENGVLPYDANQWINQVRLKRNDSSHENLGSSTEALLVLKFTFRNLNRKPFVFEKK